MLDLNLVAEQVASMVSQLKAGLGEHRAGLSRALGLLADGGLDYEKLKAKAAASRTTFLVAGLTEPPGGHHAPASLPPEYSVIATDGSQIGLDRHQTARCFLLNTGRVRLDYGQAPSAELSSLPHLYAGADELVVACGARHQPIDANLLGIKRAVEEIRHLAEMGAALPPGRTALALVDGSLIMWSLASKDIQDFVVDELLHRGFLAHLSSLREAARQKVLVPASYISFPRSTDVVNTLRLALCPYEPADCDRHCRELVPGRRPCDALGGVLDADLFASLLPEGRRSALFMSQSQIVRNHYGDNRVYFFYLKAGDEMARVEVPEWVAAEPARLALSHALIAEQCRLGQGYPVALSEAHEQAVVTAADAEQFRLLVEGWLADEHLPVASSAKSRSKRTRWI